MQTMANNKLTKRESDKFIDEYMQEGYSNFYLWFKEMNRSFRLRFPYESRAPGNTNLDTRSKFYLNAENVIFPLM